MHRLTSSECAAAVNYTKSYKNMKAIHSLKDAAFLTKQAVNFTQRYKKIESNSHSVYKLRGVDERL